MRALTSRLVALTLLWPAIVVAQTQIFDAAISNSISGIPSAIAVGDVDGDGHLDVVTANSDGASVTLLAGDGTGMLSPYGTFGAGTVPAGMVMGLLDADQVPDLLVSNANTATLSFLHGSRNPDDCPQGAPACFILAPDPITLLGFCTGNAATGCNPAIVDSQGHDQCTLAGQGTCSAVDGPGGMAIGDLNGDGFPDIAVASEGNGDGDGTVSILLGHGDGTYTVQPARQSGSHSIKTVIADFNGDKKNDVAVINAVSNDVWLFLGDGQGNFSAPIMSAIGASPSGLAAGDFDEDGHLDLAVTFVSATGEGVAFLKGDGKGDFVNASMFAAGDYPSDVTAADMNGDHHLDLVVSNLRSADASVLLGDGHGGFATARTFVSNGDPEVVGVGDLNEDGQPDLLVGDGLGFQQGDVSVLLNGGSGRFVGVEDFAIGAAPNAIAAGDVDNDALPDLAVAFDLQIMQTVLHTVQIFLATAHENFIAASDLQVSESPRALSFADFNHDGKLDLAVIESGADSTTSGTVQVFLGNGDGSFQLPQSVTIAAQPVASVVGDFDNNRIPDLAIVSLGSPGVVSILLGKGDGTFRSAAPVTVGNTPLSLAVAMANGDAFQDLLVANSVSSDVSILLGNGDGTFHSGGLVGLNSGTGPVGIAVFDVNRDGFDDFAVAQATTSNVVVFTGNGAGNFTVSSACQNLSGCSVGSSPTGLVARDLDGDGRPDLAVSNQVSNTVSLLMNSSTGRLQHTAEIILSRQPKVIASADFTGSGRYDVATGNASTAMNVSRLTNSGATPVLRGDANADGRVSAADLIAATLEVTDGDSNRPEDVGRSGYMPSPCVNGVCAGRGVDANGDGVVTSQDIGATAVRIFTGG